MALETLLPNLEEINPIPTEGYWKFHRGSTGDWQGQVEQKPGSFFSLEIAKNNLIDKLAEDIKSTLEKDYPDYLKGVGVANSFGILEPRTILTQLSHEIFNRFHTFTIGKDQMDQLMIEVSNFFDKDTVRLKLSAPVLNLYGSSTVPPINLSDGTILRPITDEECTSFYGGNTFFNPVSRRILRLPHFIFTKELEVPKVLGERYVSQDDLIFKPMQQTIEKCLTALATFKEGGPVGYDGIHVVPAELTFGYGFGVGTLWGNEYTPLGHYELTEEEVPRFESHLNTTEIMHSSLAMSSRRLADAVRRTNPIDAIVDVVIGFESILLNNTSEKKYVGELRYRFSLNYSSLFPKEERIPAFYRARSLYDLRSIIAHGGNLKKQEQFDGKKMNIHEIALATRNMLRETIDKFKDQPEPLFLEEDYWIKKVLM